MKELNDREKILISCLRKNGKKNILEISKNNNIPKSTMFDTLKNLEKNKIFNFKILVDFEKVGFPIKNFYVIKTNMKNRSRLRYYLKQKNNVNSLYDLGLKSDLFFSLFKNNNSLSLFTNFLIIIMIIYLRIYKCFESKEISFNISLIPSK